MAYDDFGFDLGEIAGGLTDLPMGGLPSDMGGLPLPDFGSVGANFYPGEGLGAPLSTLTDPSFTGPAGDMGGGAGFFGTLSKFASEALPFLRLGAPILGAYAAGSALNRAGQQQGALDRAQRTSESAAAPGVAAAGELIPAGTKALMGGALPPELESQVNAYINNARTRARQALAKMGLTSSDAAVQMDAWIEQQAQELRAKLAAGLLQSGTGAIPPGVTGQAGQIASSQSATINQAMQEANRALYALLGQQG